jgi:hypothetical protein
MRPKASLRLEELEPRLLLKGPADAPPLGPPPAPGPSVIWVDTEAELQSAVHNLQSGQTIVIQKGTYTLTRELNLGLNRPVANVTLRGETENFADVVLRGQGMENRAIGMGISVYNAHDVTIANLSVGAVYYHAINLQGHAGADRVRLYHTHLFDAGEQIIKSNPGGGGADDCTVEYSLIEYTAGTPSTDHGAGIGYSGGISAHETDNWVIRHNLFRNFHTPDSSAWLYNPVVLVWNHSSNTVVEGNTFLDVDRAVALGLEDKPGFDHQGGVIRNNIVYLRPGLFSAGRTAGSDGLLLVYDSPGTKVDHNTVLTNGNTVKSIEVRWATTGVEFRNNLADAPVGARNEGVFAASGNYLSASAAMFADPARGDFHLVANDVTRATVIDQAAPISGLSHDWDGDARPSGASADIGADELVSRPVRYALDFGTATSPVAAGYTPITPATTYTTSLGFGWQSGSISGRDHGSGPDLTRDLHFTTQGTFAVDLPGGTYVVSFTMGDAESGHDLMGVFLEGVPIDTVTTAAGEFVTRAYKVAVRDGQLTLRLSDLGGQDPHVVLNALVVTPLGTQALASVPTPTSGDAIAPVVGPWFWSGLETETGEHFLGRKVRRGGR